MTRKFVIWGAGVRGGVIWNFLKNQETVAAFIDSDTKIVGQRFCGLDVVTFEAYLSDYNECFIIISPVDYKEIVDFLKKEGIHRYFILRECPSEMQEFAVPSLFEQLPFHISEDEEIAIYGLNLFSIMLYDRLLKRGYHHLSLIPHRDTDLDVLYEIEKTFTSYNIQPFHALNHPIDRILLTHEYDGPFVKGEHPDDRIENAYDFSDVFDIYHNPKIEKFNHIHDGKRGFVVATGSSLRMEDLERLHKNHEICISMNRIYCEFDHTDWRPDYYVILDKAAVMQLEGEVRQLDIPNKFVTDGCLPFWEHGNDEAIYRFHEHCNPINPALPGFSDNFAQKAYNCYTVTFTCLQLAVYLGLKEIYLLGTDFDYHENNEKHIGHFSKSYTNNITKINSVLSEEHLLGYKKAKEYADIHGIRIYNATRGGKLEVFERKDFDSLF